MLKALICILAMFDSTIAWGFDLGLSKGSFLAVDESYIEWRKYEAYRNPYLPEKDDWQWVGEIHNTVSAWKRLYWQTNIHMSMDESQIKYGGLEYYLGVKIMPYLQAIKYHHSEHCFDKDCPSRFPVEDSYGFRLYFKQ